MKPLLILGIFIMIMVFAQFAQAQTADDVIEKNITAMGGKDKLASLNSVRMQGNMNVQGTDIAITITRLHGIGSRTDIEVMGAQNYQIITPASGIVFFPVQGQSEPGPMPDDQYKAGVASLDLHGIFVNYKEKGTQIVMSGKETVEGVECYKLKVTFRNGNVSDFYIDAKTDRLFKASTKLSVNGQEMDNYTIFSNYKQNADGYWFAYATTNARGEIDFDKIETNIKVDESIFK